MTDHKTVHAVTYELLRTLGLTTVFGNPGSTEQTFLQDFPEDFTYVLALQEASALAMADGFAQSVGKPALVNLHTAAGVGNAMGSLVAAYRANTPLIVTAGQQTREMSLCDPYLNNREATALPTPWVKWAYEPVRAEDVPAAVMQAYAVALQPPAGPVFLSIPLDDWQKSAVGPATVRTVSQQTAPDALRLREFAERINRAEYPLLVLGPEVDRAGGWNAGIAFAEKLGAPVRASALTDRVSFPEDHQLYAGPMPMTIAEVNQVVSEHDMVIVIGAQAFRYYPFVAGEYLPEGTELIQFTVDPHLASVAPVGDSLLGDVRVALEQLVDLIDEPTERPVHPSLNRDRAVRSSAPSEPLTADEVYATLSTVKPADAAVVMESTSTMAELLQWLPTTRPGSFFATGSGGIGWGVPGAVGVALGDRERGVERHIVATIGDGSFQYSVQAIWTAAQHRLPSSSWCCAMGLMPSSSRSPCWRTRRVYPRSIFPGWISRALARGFGCRTANVDTTEELAREFTAALQADGPTVIVVPTQPELPHLG